MLGVALGLAVLAFRLPPMPQPASYHQFADQRHWLGIPNFANVASNLAFAIVGLWGLRLLLSPDTLKNPFIESRERLPYVLAFVGLLLTAIGSAYYHLAPNNSRLVWDRLPMTIVFGSLIAVVIAEFISLEAGLKLLPFLIAIAAGSVVQWYYDELRGRGDLRIYATVQVYSALVLLMPLLLKSRYSRRTDFVIVFGFYALAKLFELADKSVFRFGHFVSGHTLKHLAAAMAGYWILLMLDRRAPLVPAAERYRELICAPVQSPFMRRAALFYNPHSGRRKKYRLQDVEAAASVLRNAGVEVEVDPTRAASDAAAQVRMAIRDGFDTIVACGGDGTIHDVLQGLAGKAAALGVIPLGTANAFAHDLRIPLNPASAAKALLTATPRKIAAGRIDYRDFNNLPTFRYFTVAAGVGVDAHLFYNLNRLIKDRMGMMAYYSKATHLWLTHRMRYFEAEFSANGGPPLKEARLSEMLAVRINYFGGVLRELAPGASLARNDMRLVLCRTGNRALYLAYVFRGILGMSHGVPGIELAHADQVTCRNIAGEKAEKIYVEADGELLGRLPMTLSMVPDALTVLVPQNHPDL